MEKPYYKAIFLVLASDNDPIYKFFKTVWESYMFENPNIRVFFTYGQGTTFDRKEYDLVYDDLKETYTPPYMTTKVTRAMDHINQNYAYDYLIRTNLSTFWVFDSILKRLDTLPKQRCLAGKIGWIKPEFVTGTSMIISSDLIEPLLENQHLINRTFPKYQAEDRLISNLLTQTLKVQIISASQYLSLIHI